MTHKDIYTKFMIEYDKANVTSSYPSLTEYEIATVLDKAYNALIAQKVTGNNVRRVGLEGDLKAISDIAPLIVQDNDISLYPSDYIKNVLYTDIDESLTSKFLYFVGCHLNTSGFNEAQDEIAERQTPVKLVDHATAQKFFVSSYNMPWVKIPVCYIEDKTLYIVYDSLNSHQKSLNSCSITYIKEPHTFVKNLNKIAEKYNIESDFTYFNEPAGTDLDEYKFECNDTVAEELISLAITFALENVESPRLNTKLNTRGLEA